MERIFYTNLITAYARNHPVVAILGPRQCGKTTLARQYFKTHPPVNLNNYFDLEDPADLARLQQPKIALENCRGLIVIDEIQRSPDLFPLLRVLVDQDNSRQFLILGSASRELIRQSSESLAGRIAYLELSPFSSFEVDSWLKLWRGGGFPRAFLAQTAKDSYQWRNFYISTFLEQDIPNLGIQIPATALRRFWAMLAHYHGNIFKASEIGRSLAIADTTVRRYLDILTGTLMIRQLQPWHENTKKRQVKSVKIYFRDSGILHALLGIQSEADLNRHPKLGASWEGFALEQVIRSHQSPNYDCFFWATHGGGELDLLLFQNNQRLGFEFKYADAPTLTKSMQISMETLKLDQLTVIYPGEKSYPLADHITVTGLTSYINGIYGDKAQAC